MDFVSLLLVASSLVAAPLGAQQSNIEREQRLVEEMSLNLFDGEVIELADGDRSFAGVLIEHAKPRGAVILLHGRGVHADWPDVVGPLRVSLAEDGYTTLSLQMPVLDKGATYYDYVPLFAEADRRIDAGIRFIRQQTDAPLILLAHSCGAHMAMHWLEGNGDSKIDAVVGAGLGATDYGQDLVQPFPLDKISVPIFDVLGEDEYPRVLELAAKRAKYFETDAHPHSEQVFIDGADHFFKDRNEALGQAVANWLDGLY